MRCSRRRGAPAAQHGVASPDDPVDSGCGYPGPFGHQSGYGPMLDRVPERRGRTAVKRAGEVGGDPPGPRPGAAHRRSAGRTVPGMGGWAERATRCAVRRPWSSPTTKAASSAHEAPRRTPARASDSQCAPRYARDSAIRTERPPPPRPRDPRTAGRYQRDDRGDHGHGGGDRMPGRKRGTARGHQRSGRPGPIVDPLQRADQDLG